MAAVAGGIALVVWCLLFAILIFKKKKEGRNDGGDAEDRVEEDKVGERVKPSLFEMQIPESPGPVLKPKKFTIIPKSKPENSKKYLYKCEHYCRVMLQMYFECD